MLAHEHDAIEHGGDEEQRELCLPGHVHLVAQNPAHHGANDKTGRPGGVQNVQVVRTVLREQRGNQRIGNGFKGAVSHGEDEGAPEEETERVVWIGRAKGHQSGDHMQNEGGDDELAVADLVRHDTADDDAKAEACETGTPDGAELAGCESILMPPVSKDAATDGKADASGENGHEAGPE